MSLTTVAAPIRPDENLARLAPSQPERFQRSDFIAAGLVFLITLGVYIATLAPNVTLQDSGELITAATKFGVGHPPGYPLWTMSGFLLTHLFPFGDLAWRMNLLCALIGGASNAVLTLLACHSGRWLLQRWTEPEIQAQVRPYVFYMGLLVGLTIGFSDVMWSQAVISAVHGTLNALFVNLVLLFFYLWMLEPRKTRRLVWCVFIFALGLTNHHTLVQVIPGFILTAALIEFVPLFRGKEAQAPTGLFFSVFLSINLFSLSILVYLSWLSGDPVMHTISEDMAMIILVMTCLISFFYLKQFRWQLFLFGVATTLALFAYGHYLMTASDDPAGMARLTPSDHVPFFLWGSLKEEGWTQIATLHGLLMLGLTALALGLLYTSTLDRRMVIGIFVVGWLGLTPYSYLPLASSTNPPMNWGFPSERPGFYYAVSREQYPKSLPTLIKMTFGKAIGVVDKNAQLDSTIGLPDYWKRLYLSLYYYGYNLQANVTVPLIFLTLAVLLYLRRCDWPQVNWFIFLGVAFFLLGFMLQAIAPQEAFDYEHTILYKVFHLQSHCIFAILIGYGALAAMVYLHETMPEVTARVGVAGFGIPCLFLSLLPFWSNFDGCNQANHWFGYYFGADIMRPMAKNAVYYGGSDPGRFVPTYMAFVESQQPDRWKHEPGFDRRDVAVITQNALCDTYYASYIRNQYDNRFRPSPESYSAFDKWLGRDKAYPKTQTICVSEDELKACWAEYRQWPDVQARIKAYGEGAIIRAGTTDVFDVNGIVAKAIFEKNKKNHTFYLEQSVPIAWMYPYMVPFGLIFELKPDPLPGGVIPPDVIEKDRQFWDAYQQRLLTDPNFAHDDDAKLTFSKLAMWHADLYDYHHLDKEEEHWLRISLSLCPQLPDAVRNMVKLLAREQRFDEAADVAQKAQDADPLNDVFVDMSAWVQNVRTFGQQETALRAQLAKAPYDIGLNLSLAQLLQSEGKLDELNDRMRLLAGLTNWSRQDMGDVMQYYVDKVRNPYAALAFLEARAKIDSKSGELLYNLAALYAVTGQQENAMKYLEQATNYGGNNATEAAAIDPRFSSLRADPRFQAMMSTLPPPGSTNAPAVVPPSTNGPGVVPPAPAKAPTHAETKKAKKKE